MSSDAATITNRFKRVLESLEQEYRQGTKHAPDTATAVLLTSVLRQFILLRRDAADYLSKVVPIMIAKFLIRRTHNMLPLDNAVNVQRYNASLDRLMEEAANELRTNYE